MPQKYINIQYPFVNSSRGFFLELTDNDNQAIKSDLMHLILTKKGERYYLPDFGTNLLQYIFEPNDGISQSKVLDEITTAVKKYMPNLSIDQLDINTDTENEYTATVTIKYTVTDEVFTSSDIIVINL